MLNSYLARLGAVALLLTGCGRQLTSSVDASSSPVTFSFVSNVDDDVLLSLVVAGPQDDCEAAWLDGNDASAVPALEPVVWSITDDAGLPSSVAYGETFDDVEATTPAEDLTSGECYYWRMSSTGGQEWGAFTAP